MFKFDKDKIKITISNQVALIIIGIVIVLCILFANGLSSTIVGFWGSILGGIIGGIFTVIGVSQSIRHESEKTRVNELSQTIIQLLEMKKQVDNYYNDLNELQLVFNQIDWQIQKDLEIITNLFPTRAEMLFSALGEFSKRTAEFEFRMLQASISVDVETYQKISERTLKVKLLCGRCMSMLVGEIRDGDGKSVKFGTFSNEVASLRHDASVTVVELQDFLIQKTSTYMQEYEKLKK